MRFPRRLAFATLSLFAPLALFAVTPPAGAAPALAPLDPTWGAAGIASFSLPDGGYVRSIARSPGGTVVMGVHSIGARRFELARLDASGSLDPSFAGDGTAETDLEPGRHSALTDLAVRPDGRIVAAGFTFKDNATRKFALARYRADGTLDPTFSGDGKLLTTFAEGSVIAPSVALGADGSVAVAGRLSDSRLAVARYRADGSLDRSFDGDGKLVLDLPGSKDDVADIALDGSALVLVGAAVDVDTGADTAVVRVLPDGRLDPAFGVGGIVMNDFGIGHDVAESVALDPERRIITAGAADGDLALARHLPSGQLDESFGVGGRVIVAAGPNESGTAGTGVAVLPDGRIAASGTHGFEGADIDTMVAVLASDGTPDPAFDGEDGIVLADLGTEGHFDEGGLLAVEPDGRMLVASSSGPGFEAPGPIAVARLVPSAPLADVGVALSAPGSASAGPVELLATVGNDGPVTATGVTLSVEVSQGITPPRVSQGRCALNRSRTTATCQLGDLQPGAQALVSTGTTVTGFEEGLFASATVTTTSIDPNPANDAVAAEVVISRDPVA